MKTEYPMKQNNILLKLRIDVRQCTVNERIPLRFLCRIELNSRATTLCIVI